MEDLDLRETNKEVKWEYSQGVHDRSKLWANIANPFAWFVFSLISMVIVMPFIIIMVSSIVNKTDHMDALMRWSTTVLAPIVGFGSAVIGYYFGASGHSENRNK